MTVPAPPAPRGVLVIGAASPIGQAICRAFPHDTVIAVTLPPPTPPPTTPSGLADPPPGASGPVGASGAADYSGPVDTPPGASGAANASGAVGALGAADYSGADGVFGGGGEAGWLFEDCSTAAGAQRAVDAVVAKAGGVDVVVLAAAAMPVAPITETSDDQWQLALAATLGTAFAVSRAALPHMRAGGSIVAISSVNATLAAPGVPAYAAAKSGLEGLVRQLALEYGPRGIRVNAVAPGLIGPVGLAEAAAGYPLGRVGEPAEVAAAVHFLAGAGFVTGVVLPVDGGLSIASPAAFLRPDLRARWLS